MLTARTVWASPLSRCLDLCPRLSDEWDQALAAEWMISYCKLDRQWGSLGNGGWRLKPEKGLQAGLLKADWRCVSREHEKEVQNRKRGKRPRGRPRKHTVTSSCSRRSKLKVSCSRLCLVSSWLLTHLCCSRQKFFRGAVEVGTPLSCCSFRPPQQQATESHVLATLGPPQVLLLPAQAHSALCPPG